MPGVAEWSEPTIILDQRDPEYYARPGPLTELAGIDLPAAVATLDARGLVAFVQNLLIHRFWAAAYGVAVPPEREREQGLHAAAAMLAQARALRDGPIDAARTPGERVFVICRHFAVLLCALLRRNGVPARARCGFATYFEPGKYVDHWVCEYWDAGAGRWRLVDAQLDALQLAAIKPDFDPQDVPRERFWVAGQAWQRIRAGKAADGRFGPGDGPALDLDPNRFGIADMWGSWYVAGNLLHDAAALRKVELLPWDTFGLMRADHRLEPGEAELLDRLAAITVGSEAPGMPDDLEALLDANDVLRAPPALIEQALRADREGAPSANPLTAGGRIDLTAL